MFELFLPFVSLVLRGLFLTLIVCWGIRESGHLPVCFHGSLHFVVLAVGSLSLIT